jgi:hypothetical protein
MSSEPNPQEGLDLEQNTAAPAKGNANLLDEADKPKSQVEEAEVVDFDDEEIYRRPGELGVCGEKTPGIKHRFSVMPSTTDPSKAFLRRVWTHWVIGKGHAKCLSKRDSKGNFIGEMAFCCKGPDGPSQARLSALVCEYTCIDPKTAKFKPGIGSPEVPFTFEIKCLLMSTVAGRHLSEKTGENDEGVSLKVPQVDFFYKAAEGKKGLEFEKISSKASYTRNPTLQNPVMAMFDKYKDGHELARRMSRNLNVNQMREHLGISGGSVTGGTEEVFQDL